MWNWLKPSIMKNVLYEDIETLLLTVVNGEEEYMILRSKDGFLQFFGMNDKFVAETRVNLPDGDFRTYSIINKERKQAMDKITVHTMLDKSEVPACEVISLEMLRAAVRAYYSNGHYESFLKQRIQQSRQKGTWLPNLGVPNVPLLLLSSGALEQAYTAKTGSVAGSKTELSC